MNLGAFGYRLPPKQSMHDDDKQSDRTRKDDSLSSEVSPKMTKMGVCKCHQSISGIIAFLLLAENRSVSYKSYALSCCDLSSISHGYLVVMYVIWSLIWLIILDLWDFNTEGWSRPKMMHIIILSKRFFRRACLGRPPFETNSCSCYQEEYRRGGGY